MCGIFGYIGTNLHAASITLAGLKRLEYRGYDSWGVAAIPADTLRKEIIVKKDIGKIGQATVDDLPESNFAFGHTRWATHGGVTVANAHPHLDCQKQIAVIHNGIVENYVELKKSLKKNHVFSSETDTEVIVHLIEEKMTTMSLDQAVLTAFNQLKGNNAIIVINRQTRQMIAAKNGSPLILGFGEDGNYLASDPAALLPHTKIVHFLEDFEMAILSDTDIRIFNTQSGQEIPAQKQTLNWSVEETSQGDYASFMEKEMFQQPGIINKIALQTESETRKIVELLRTHDDIVFLGCGTASYACMAATYLFSEIAHKKVTWQIASECQHQLPFFNQNTLIVALSQSGETMDLISVIKKAQSQGAKVIAMVNVLGSTLYRISDEQILIGAGPEKAVASTKAFIGKISHLIRLAYAYDHRFQAGQDFLIKTSQAAQAVLAPDNWQQIKDVASKLLDYPHIFVIGRGISSVAAIEIALKIKEISYLHAEGIVGGELKHGPLALIEKNTPCIVIAADDESRSSIVSSAMEIKARGGQIIGIATQNDPTFDFFLPITAIDHNAFLPAIIAGQILAYQLTLLKKLDPDKPRNLAKSVTVG